jgi:predicted DNA-binding transcriptional regulator AlpA
MPQRSKFKTSEPVIGRSSQESGTLSLLEAVMLKATDLEALLKIDVKTIYRYAQRGLIPYVRIQSNLRFRKREILEWLDRQSHHS